MRGGTNTRGYTIVEVMIFLAISGLMFVMAATFISGRQAKSQFRQGMNDINTQVQQTISDVSNGFYPSNSDFSCSAGASGAITFGGGANNEQGANKGCTFIGKVMQFGVSGTDSAGYNVYTVVGRQFQTDASTLIPPTNFAEAKPVAVTSAVPGATDLTQVKTLEWGLQVDSMYDGDTSHSIGAFGFFTGFASTTKSDLNSGAATPVAVVIPTSALDQPATNINGEVASLGIPSTVIDTSPQITLCFKGSANQYGRLTIGGSDNVQGQRLATHIQISDHAPTGICQP